MHWHHVQLSHARHDSIDLYVRDQSRTIEVLVGRAEDKACFSADVIVGRLCDISFDQKHRSVPWAVRPLPAYCRTPQIDCRKDELIPGHGPTLDYLKVALANAMNRTIKDRGFSRFAKKTVVGSWTDTDSTLTFAADGVYAIDGVASAIPFHPPREGRWSIGSNMLHLMSHGNDHGVRVPIVRVSDSELIFHGQRGALFHIYERKKPNRVAGGN